MASRTCWLLCPRSLLNTPHPRKTPVTRNLKTRYISDLRPAFDIPQKTTNQRTGLFAYPELDSPQGWDNAAERALVTAKRLVNTLSGGEQKLTNATPDSKTIVKTMDQLSDTLCSVIDAAELVRTIHPEPKIVDAANRAYEKLCDYMNTLNTHSGLYEATKLVANDPNASKTLTRAERQVAKSFLQDFEKCGIHLPPAKKAVFVDLSNRISILSRAFSQGARPSSTHVSIRPLSKLDGLPPNAVRSFTVGQGEKQQARISLSDCADVMPFINDEEVRKHMFAALDSSSERQIAILEALLRTREKIAKLLGKESYAHMFLADKMLRNPENVQAFLKGLVKHHLPIAQSDIEILRQAKQQHLKSSSPVTINAWDREYYTRMARRMDPSWNPPPESISPYLSVGTVLQGLSQLFSKLYGVAFQLGTLQPGEAWHPQVRKFDVIDNDAGNTLRGTIYCDLFARPGKNCGAAHYTVRCSRRVDDDVIVKDANPVHGVEIPHKVGKYQLPIVALICNFHSSDEPRLLRWAEYETLFHEMGHAMHSMLGTTDFHNVAGTRCPIDFVELPSVLMEFFAADPRVLSLFARHYKTNDPLPPGLLEAHTRHRRFLSGIEEYNQIFLAQLDHALHTTEAPENEKKGGESFTTTVYHSVSRRSGLFPIAAGSTWHGQFGHLDGYGSGYYSYLFGKALARKIWNCVFAKDPLSREAGKRYREEVLRWGGGRDPWECVEGLLGEGEGEGGEEKEERDLDGDEVRERVEEVGRWGTL